MPRLSRRHLLSAFGAALAPAAVRAERRRISTEYFEVTEVEVYLASLDPAHDGLRVGQLSDIHIGSGVPDGRVIAAVRAMNELQPDLVALTGDFITSRWDPVSRVPQLLGSLVAPGVAVLGNHDHWTFPREIAKGLEGVGISVLQNQHTELRLRGVGFSVVGIDDATCKLDDVSCAFTGVQRDSQLVLTHTPACAKKLPAWKDVLCLSGHTHGGQWDVPKLTKGVFTTAGQPYYRGHYPVRGNQLYVNRGLGFGKGTRLPRLNADPELTVLTLRYREPA